MSRINLEHFYPPIPDGFHIMSYGSMIFYREGWELKGVQSFNTRSWCKCCGFDEQTTMYWVLKYGDTLPSHMDILLGLNE